MRNENHFQSALIKEIKGKLEGCYILKNDGSNVPQGFPDLLILYGDKWGTLECKREAGAERQNNQDFYVVSSLARTQFRLASVLFGFIPT